MVNFAQTGGTAFPLQDAAIQEGMTLRDYFAAKAMVAFLSGNNHYEEKAIAAQSYRMADAMLATKDKLQYEYK